MMDPVSAQRLAEITAKEPAALTEEDIGFMRARRSYLTSDQREVFAEFLEAGPDAPKPYSKMSLQELASLAADRNVAIESGDKKADVIAKLEAADAQ